MVVTWKTEIFVHLFLPVHVTSGPKMYQSLPVNTGFIACTCVWFEMIGIEYFVKCLCKYARSFNFIGEWPKWLVPKHYVRGYFAGLYGIVLETADHYFDCRSFCIRFRQERNIYDLFLRFADLVWIKCGITVHCHFDSRASDFVKNGMYDAFLRVSVITIHWTL